MLCHTNSDTAYDVDERNDDASYRIAADKLARTIHSPIKIRLFGDLLSSAPCFFLIYEPCVEIRIYRHLLTRHRVKGEASPHFADTLGSFGDDDEVDSHQHDKNDDPDDIVAPYHILPEALDKLPRRIGTFVPMQEDSSSGGYVEREAK